MTEATHPDDAGIPTVTHPHDWRGDTRECAACGYTYASGSWRMSPGSTELFEEPSCSLVPPSAHTPGPWRVDAPPHRDLPGLGKLANFIVSDTKIIAIGVSDNVDEALLARAPALRDAAEATILFHAPGWDDERATRWRVLVGVAEASPRTLLNFVRRCLR